VGGEALVTAAKERGNRGEAYVAQYLEAHGCAVLERQFRCRYGEIDLVARTADGTVCFVEVKLRGPDALGLPREAVGLRKRERLRKAASCYLAALEEEPTARFDVAEVYLDGHGRLARVEYLEDAFL